MASDEGCPVPEPDAPAGGATPPMMNVFQPALGAEELVAVKDVFASNWVGKGAVTDRFEADFAAYAGVDRGLMRSVSCCTEGTFQAMTLLGLGPGDEVVLPSISFVGAANAVLASGARPVFCDVDPRTLNPTARSIEERLTRRTKAVLVLHYGGVPCPLAEICALLDERKVALIEDSACSVASRYRGRACGTFGEIGLWSFDSMKILVTGDGGMVYCRTPEMAERLGSLVYLGLDRQSGLSTPRETRWWEFEVVSLGRRAIMNDVAAAIGRVQLRKLPGFVERRRQIHEHYDRELAALPWLETPPALPADAQSSYYFYWVQAPQEARDALAVHLRARGIYTTFRYHPLHRVQWYGSDARLPGAEAAAESTLCLPIHQSLTAEDLEQVVGAIRDFGTRL